MSDRREEVSPLDDRDTLLLPRSYDLLLLFGSSRITLVKQVTLYAVSERHVKCDTHTPG